MLRTASQASVCHRDAKPLPPRGRLWNGLQFCCENCRGDARDAVSQKHRLVRKEDTIDCTRVNKAMKISVITLLSAIGCVAADHGLRRGLESRSLEEFIEVNSAFPAAAFVTLDPRDPVVAVAFDLSGGFVEGYCGTTFGTDVSGTIKEKELKDGTARIEFNLKIKNAWSAVVEWSPQGMPLDFPNWLYGTNHFTQTCGDPEAASLATVNLYYRIHVDEPGLPLLSYLAQFQQGQVEFLDMVLRAETPTGAKVRVHKKLLFDNPNCADDDKVPPPFYNYVNGDNIYAGLVCEPVAEVSIHE